MLAPKISVSKALVIYLENAWREGTRLIHPSHSVPI